MGKATKWLRAVLGLKKSDGINPPLSSPVDHHSTSHSKEKRRWSFVKSYREKDQFPQHNHYAHSLLHQSQRGVVSHGTDKALPSMDDCGGGLQSSSPSEEDPNKHAIAVAAATAAVAEAAVAAAQAAAEVVRLTSSGRSGNSNSNSNNNLTAAYVSGSSNSGAWRDDVDLLSAAVKIQSAFRGYLARRALRALKSLVRLQALVRGHIERKRTAEWLHRMQALLRAQARARSVRVKISESSHSSCKSSHFHQAGPPTPENFEHSFRARSGKYEQSQKLKRTGSKSNSRALSGDNEVTHLSFNRSERRMEERAWDHWKHSARTGMVEDENIDKILEIDPGKPHFTPKRRNLFHSSHLAVGGSDQYSHSFTTSKDSTTHQTVQSPSSGGEVQSLSPLKFSHELEEKYCTAANSPQLYSAASSKGGSGKISPFTPTKSDGSRSFISGYSDHPNYMSTTESSKAKVRSLSAPRQRPQYERSSSTKRYSILGFGGEARSSSVQQASALRSSFTSKAYPGSGRLDRLGMPVGQMY